jgi:hypothetical protein
VKFPGPTRQQETEPSQTGLRRRRESFVRSHREANATAPVLDSTRTSLIYHESKCFPVAHCIIALLTTAKPGAHNCGMDRDVS